MTRPQRILIVDDEVAIRDVAGPSLELAGYDVRTEPDGYLALQALAAFSPDLVVLDINMPGIDGYEVVRRMRSSGHTVPVIFLSARDAVEDRVDGFEVGGDDYLTKPFHLKELLARVAAVLKRADTARTGTARLACGLIEIDDATHQVWRDGAPVELTPTEYRLLQFLLRNAGVVVSKAQILDQVWGSDETGTSVVDTFISTLRSKVDRGDPRVIHTVRGFGYVARDDR
jgi:two-component system OmpR family response regulator